METLYYIINKEHFKDIGVSIPGHTRALPSLAAQPLAKNGGSGNTAILKLFCRNAINKLCGWWETL